MYNTGNPVPSTALEDMADNAQTFDALVTKTEGATTDRLGNTRRVFQQIIMDMGFQPLSGSFQTGATITARNQTLYDEISHVFYAWSGVIPAGGYIVPAGSTPSTAGGIGVGAWSDKTDLTLRSDINIVQKRFACVADAVADTSLTVGKIIETIGYHNGWQGAIEGPKGGNRYEVVAGGTGVADGGAFINLDNGLQLKGLFVDGVINANQFGAFGDAAQDDTLYIENAIKVFGRVCVSDDSIKINNLKLTSKCDIYSEVGTTIISDSSPFNLGTLGWKEQDLLSYVSCSGVISGRNYITVPLVNVTNFNTGDSVFIRGGTYFTSAEYKIYDWSMVNIVTAVNASTGDVSLKYKIDEDVSPAGIANISTTSVTQVSTGDAIFITEDTSIVGFNVISAGTLFKEGGGCINSRFEFINIDTDSFAYSNAISLSTFSVNHVKFKRHLFELGLGSSYNSVSVKTAVLTSNPVFGKRPIRLSEGVRSCTVKCNTLDLDLHSNGDVPLYLSEGRKNKIEIGFVTAKNTYPRIVNYGAQALTPTPPRCEDNKLSIWVCEAGSSTSYVLYSVSGLNNKKNSIHDTSFRGVISGGRAIEVNGDNPSLSNVKCEYGALYVSATASTPEVKSCYFKDDFHPDVVNVISGSPRIVGILSEGWDSASSQNKNVAALTVSSSSSSNIVSSQLFPASSLKVGDIVNYSIPVTATGTTGTKNVELWLAGTKIVDVAFGTAVTGSVIISGSIRVQTSTAIRYQFNKAGDSTMSGASVGSLTVPDISSNSLGVELMAYRADGNTLTINGFVANIKRAGHL